MHTEVSVRSSCEPQGQEQATVAIKGPPDPLLITVWQSELSQKCYKYQKDDISDGGLMV